MVIALLVLLLCPSLVHAMNKESSHESHFHFSQKGQRSPKVTKVMPSRSFSDISDSKSADNENQTPTNSPESSTIFDIYTQTGFMQQIPVATAVELAEGEEVKKECTKFKLLLLTSATALVSSGVTAAITYFQTKC